MALSPAAIATAIAGLSKIDTDITVKDLDEILDQVKPRDTPLLMPGPEYITAFAPDILTTGSGTGRFINVGYTINYRFFYSAVGAKRKLSTVYQGLTNKVLNIIETFLANDRLGAIDVTPLSIDSFGVVPDPAGNQFFGCDMSFRVLEFMS